MTNPIERKNSVYIPNDYLKYPDNFVKRWNEIISQEKDNINTSYLKLVEDTLTQEDETLKDVLESSEYQEKFKKIDQLDAISWLIKYTLRDLELFDVNGIYKTTSLPFSFDYSELERWTNSIKSLRVRGTGPQSEPDLRGTYDNQDMDQIFEDQEAWNEIAQNNKE
jgi:hypothetical protein